MSVAICPYCGAREMRAKTVAQYQTQIGGIPFAVKNAKMAECGNCGRKAFEAKELKRWELELRKHMQARGGLVTPKRVREIRESLGLSVSQFAALVAVTRQTVYAWEHDESAGMHLGPAALLLGLVADHLSGRQRGVVDYLVQSARERGQDIESGTPVQGGTRATGGAEPPGGSHQAVRAVPGGFPRFVGTRNAA